MSILGRYIAKKPGYLTVLSVMYLNKNTCIWQHKVGWKSCTSNLKQVITRGEVPVFPVLPCWPKEHFRCDQLSRISVTLSRKYLSSGSRDASFQTRMICSNIPSLRSRWLLSRASQPPLYSWPCKTEHDLHATTPGHFISCRKESYGEGTVCLFLQPLASWITGVLLLS